MPEPDASLALLRADGWSDFGASQTDQSRGLPHPLIEKPVPSGSALIALPAVDETALGDVSLAHLLANRRSRRHFSPEPLSLAQLGFLLWATQGVRAAPGGGRNVFRTVPSAGARHPFETNLAISRVEGLEPGLYRYLSLSHQLALISRDEGIAAKADAACLGQGFVARAAVSFLWSAMVYRTQWRYAKMAPKLILLDAGHVCQNLYLAAEAIGAGVCAVAAYDQDGADHLVQVDGISELVVYVASVGLLPERSR